MVRAWYLADACNFANRQEEHKCCDADCGAVSANTGVTCKTVKFSFSSRMYVLVQVQRSQFNVLQYFESHNHLFESMNFPRLAAKKNVLHSAMSIITSHETKLELLSSKKRYSVTMLSPQKIIPVAVKYQLKS